MIPTTANKKQKLSKVELLEIVEETISNNLNELQYTQFRQKYGMAEYIPCSNISTVMTHYFPSSELLLSYGDNHKIYKIKILELLSDSVQNWEFNRPPDLGRCPDIARYIYNSKKTVDTMIYLTYTNIKHTFEVLDGIHRLTALQIIKEENSKPLELLCPGDFGSNNDANWLYNQYLIVNIRFNSTISELIEVFQNLNKSQAVPELYIRDHTKEKRKIIDEIANEWFVKYKKHFSPSSNPNIGNTNRNKFVDLLDKIYDKYKLNENNYDKLRQLLYEKNNYLRDNIPTKISIDVRLKCKETGCYLFLYKNEKLEKLI